MGDSLFFLSCSQSGGFSSLLSAFFPFTPLGSVAFLLFSCGFLLLCPLVCVRYQCCTCRAFPCLSPLPFFPLAVFSWKRFLLFFVVLTFCHFRGFPSRVAPWGSAGVFDPGLLSQRTCLSRRTPGGRSSLVVLRLFFSINICWDW